MQRPNRKTTNQIIRNTKEKIYTKTRTKTNKRTKNKNNKQQIQTNRKNNVWYNHSSKLRIDQHQLHWNLDTPEWLAVLLLIEHPSCYCQTIWTFDIWGFILLFIVYKNDGDRLIRNRKCLPFARTWVHPDILVGSVLLIFSLFLVVLFCVFSFLVPCCDVRYDFRIKQCLVQLFLRLLQGKLMSYLRYLCLCSYGGVENIYWIYE